MNKELLSSLVGKVVKVNRGGPESRTGKVLYGGDDHFALLSEKDGVVYFNSSHVKSISQNIKSGLSVKEELSEEGLEFMKEDTLGDLLTSLKYQWVKINRGGPEKLEGILDHSSDEFVTLVLNEEVVRLATYHIKSISYGVKPEKEEKTEEEK